MATIIEDNFNSYNDGDLNGQGDWSGDTKFDIQGTTVYEGAKAVKIIGDNTQRFIEKTGNQLSEGTQVFYLRKNNTDTQDAMVDFKEDSTGVTDIKFGDTGKITIRTSGDVERELSSYSADTWYKITFEWKEDAGNPQIRAKVDDGDWSSWYDPKNDWSTGINKLDMKARFTGTAYWDNFTGEEVAVAGRSFGYIFSKIYEDIKKLAERIFYPNPLADIPNPPNL